MLEERVLQQGAALGVREDEELLAVVLPEVEGDEGGRLPGRQGRAPRARVAARRCNASNDNRPASASQTARSPSRTKRYGNCASAAATGSGQRSCTSTPRRICTSTVPPGPPAVKTIAR
ncbi:hypothetical protein [Streptomyces sp. NBC_01207]|uniref:hypothetical protein n=1 Tax=Streptomyces sp. NBC_01207 TaxID=2903772 RepID=UPI002E12745C|nr:hypothetical protein OG457_45840 [Streptomyces sp. NBC_01207]